MAAKHRTLHDLVLHQLRDLAYAERHAAKMLTKMAKVADADAVREALDRRQHQAAAHVDALDSIFDELDKKAHAVTCEAMHGIIEETKTLIDDYADGPVIDAGLIGAAQAMDHYAVARYGALALWAGQLGLSAVVGPVETILAEARRALDDWAALAGATPPAMTEGPHTLTLKEAALMGLR